MLTSHQIKTSKKKTSRRVGRGDGSGRGKTCGRGTKGQKARSKVRRGFEGGQMPLTRRIPKLKGFRNFSQQKIVTFNVSDLDKKFKSGDKINLKTFLDKKMVRSGEQVKILGDGKIKKSLTIEIFGFSKTAKEKIEKAGGKAIVVKAFDFKKDGKRKKEVKGSAEKVNKTNKVDVSKKKEIPKRVRDDIKK